MAKATQRQKTIKLAKGILIRRRSDIRVRVPFREGAAVSRHSARVSVKPGRDLIFGGRAKQSFKHIPGGHVQNEGVFL